MQRIKPTAQNYYAYTAEDFKVWKLLFNRQMQPLNAYAHPLYVDCLKQVQFQADSIPDFEETSAVLKELTGWKLCVVPELVPQKEFFELLAQKIFPATCWLRTMRELDYIEEPDMFHDVFGHVPLLANPAYARFMEGFGKLALKWLHEPEAIALLGRVYWFTIEFGLLGNGNDIHIYGAGIISSIEEIRSAISDRSVKHGFDVARCLQMPYRTDIIQEHYFVIKSFEQLYAALPLIDEVLRAKYNVHLSGIAGKDNWLD